MTDAASLHLQVLWARIKAHTGQRRADEANARTPQRRVVPMTTEARMAGYLTQGGRALPTGRQRRRLMRKAGVLDPSAIDAAWVSLRDDLGVRIPGPDESGYLIIFDEAARLTRRTP